MSLRPSTSLTTDDANNRIMITRCYQRLYASDTLIVIAQSLAMGTAEL